MSPFARSLSHSPVSSSIALNPSSDKEGKNALLAYGFICIVAFGMLLRFFVVLLAGNGVGTFWGGTGDAPAYVLLAQNLAAGRGYTLAGHPTAYHPPLYPIMLAASMRLFVGHALAAVRWLQFLEGLLVAFLCAAAAKCIFGEKTKKITLVIALFFPTLVFVTGEILSEMTATLFSALFLYLLVRFFQRPRWSILVGLSAIVGLSTLTRFNMALFGLVLLGIVIFRETGIPKWRGAAVVIFLPLLIVLPWLIRNFVDFGSPVLSTESGPAAVMGVLAPQGRALPGDSQRLVKALGWLPPQDLMTDDSSRDRLPSESVLNRRAWGVCFGLWRRTGWRLVPLTLSKLSYFWLSTDQLLSTGSFSPPVRIGRAVGVSAYWLLLVLSIGGLFLMQKLSPGLARLLLFYLALLTVLHLPFNMNTRLRIPFVDPWVAVLAGAGFAALIMRMGKRRETTLYN